MKTKEFIISVIFIFTSLLAFRLFPAEGVFQQVFTMLIFFIFIPLLFNRIILKNNLAFYNISTGDYKVGVVWSLYSLVTLAIIFGVIAYSFDFLNIYRIPAFIEKDFLNFILYEFLVVAPFVAIYEFYFRGFLMQIFKAKLHYFTILLQSIVFYLLVFDSPNNGIIQFVPYLIVAPFAGIIAYKSKSIIYSGTVQFVVLLVLNIVVIKNIH